MRNPCRSVAASLQANLGYGADLWSKFHTTEYGIVKRLFGQENETVISRRITYRSISLRDPHPSLLVIDSKKVQ